MCSAPARTAAFLLVLACSADDRSAAPDSTGESSRGTSSATTIADTSAGSAAQSSESTAADAASSSGTSSATDSSTGAEGGSASTTESVGTCARPWFTDDLEWDDIDAAIADGPWSARDGDVAISERYAHAGARSLRIAYASNESQSYLSLDLPEGTDHLFCRWWELRERAGDFVGAQDYDWGGEKFNRFRSATIGVEPDGGLDYPLGWGGAGGWGLPGTQDAGEISLFGNSVASNGAMHFVHAYAMPRGEWHAFELELRLGAPGMPEGETRLFIDDELVAEATGLVLRPQTEATIDQIWIGGWYSNGGVDPDPSPTVRYVDDVTVCADRIGA